MAFLHMGHGACAGKHPSAHITNIETYIQKNNFVPLATPFEVPFPSPSNLMLCDPKIFTRVSIITWMLLKVCTLAHLHVRHACVPVPISAWEVS
jgi:hypothetical protein